MTEIGQLGEFGLIESIARRGLIREEGVVCGIGDDCAVLETETDNVLLVTTDTIVEGVHFLSNARPEDVGHKLMAVSLSDIAAMGGQPRDAVVSLAMGRETLSSDIDALYEGIHACAAEFGANVVGGDTVSTPGPSTYTLTLLGRQHANSVCYRSGARPGDLVYVSGTLGDAAAGLALLQDDSVALEDSQRRFLQLRHRRPEARIALGLALASSGAVSSMLDLSDGIASDLGHICRASGVGAVIERDRVPISDALRAFEHATGIAACDMALGGGEDFELLFTVPQDRAGVLDRLEGQLPPLSRIGRISSGEPAISLVGADGTELPLVAKGFEHFRSP